MVRYLYEFVYVYIIHKCQGSERIYASLLLYTQLSSSLPLLMLVLLRPSLAA